MSAVPDSIPHAEEASSLPGTPLPHVTEPPEEPSDARLEQYFIKDILRGFRWRLAITYGLFTLENALGLLQPYILGWAITDLLRAASFGLIMFMGQQLAHTLISTARMMYDTRTFTSLYTTLASRLVVEQRQRAIHVSYVAARSALSREFVDFLERDVSGVLFTLYGLLGAVLMLSLHDIWLGIVCVAFLPLALILNTVYGRKSFLLNKHLNDQLEQEVYIVERGKYQEVYTHYTRLAHWRIRLSDCIALSFGWGECLTTGVILLALLRSCRLPGNTVGDLYALLRYVLMFVVGVNNLPMIVQQVTRLRDICRRLHM